MKRDCEGVEVQRGVEQVTTSQQLLELLDHLARGLIGQRNKEDYHKLIDLGTQPFTYFGQTEVLEQPVRYFYERFLDLLGEKFNSPKSDILHNPGSIWVTERYRRSGTFLDNAETFLKMFKAYYQLYMKRSPNLEQLEDLIYHRAVVHRGQTNVRQLEVFRELLDRLRVEGLALDMHVDLYNFYSENEKWLPIIKPVSRWLTAQYLKTQFRLREFYSGSQRQERLKDALGFTKELFGTVTGYLHEEEENIYEISGILLDFGGQSYPEIQGTFVPVRQISGLSNEFRVSWNQILEGQSFLLEGLCLLSLYPVIIYSLLPWLAMYLIQRREPGATFGAETDFRSFFRRGKYASFLLLTNYNRTKFGFETATQCNIFDLLNQIMNIQDLHDITIAINRHAIRTAQIMAQDIMARLRNFDEGKMEQYVSVENTGGRGESMWVLPIDRIAINFSVLPFRVPTRRHYLNQKNGRLMGGLLYAFSKSQTSITARKNFNWSFYARKKLNNIAKTLREAPEPVCIEKVNEVLEDLGLPSLDFSIEEDSILLLKKFCWQFKFNLEVVGFPEENVYMQDSEYTFLASPHHLELVSKRKARPSIKRRSTRAAIYQKTWKPQEGYYDPYKGIRDLESWIIGKQLPLDPESPEDLQVLLRKKCLVVDIEALATSGERQTPYMICAVGYLGDDIKPTYMAFTNTEIDTYEDEVKETVEFDCQIQNQICIYQFCSWLADIGHNYTREDPLYIWGFNMMGYEITYLLPALNRVFTKVELLGQPSECRSFSVLNGAIVFADILKILPAKKLSALTKEFNTVIKKDQLDISLYKTWGEVEPKYEEIKRYCFLDCVSSLLLLHKVQVGFLQLAERLQMVYTPSSIIRKITASGLGWYFFIQGFFKQSITNKTIVTEPKQGVFYNTEPQQVYQLQRSSYSGGVVQVWKYYHLGRIYYVDVNSMYPAMLRKPLPWAYIGEQNINYSQKRLYEILNQEQSDLYLYQVKGYWLPSSYLGALIPTKQLEGKAKNTYYNDYAGDDLYLRGVAIKRILHHKGEARVSKVWRYSSYNIDSFKEFAEIFYGMRKKETKDSLKTCIKLLMNSVIGRCSMRQQAQFSVTPFVNGSKAYKYEENMYLNVGDLQLPPVGRLVRLTGLITERARCYLDQLGEKAGYKNLLYCDTDSLIVNEQGYENLGRPSQTAKDLGDFKCQMEKDGREDFYVEGFFKNRKDYILKYITKDGKEKYLHKSKGIPKKYITQEYSRAMAEQIRLYSNIPSINRPADQEIRMGPPIQIQVWNKSFIQSGGVTIKKMIKKSNLITDRRFDQPNGVGIPRANFRFIPLNSQESDSDQDDE